MLGFESILWPQWTCLWTKLQSVQGSSLVLLWGFNEYVICFHWEVIVYLLILLFCVFCTSSPLESSYLDECGRLQRSLFPSVGCQIQSTWVLFCLLLSWPNCPFMGHRQLQSTALLCGPLCRRWCKYTLGGWFALFTLVLNLTNPFPCPSGSVFNFIPIQIISQPVHPTVQSACGIALMDNVFATWPDTRVTFTQ